MRNVKTTRIFFMALLVLVFGAVQASLLDGTVLINRAANNRTITVQYDGVSAAMVEMRVNGESIATRAVSSKSAEGETNFALNPAILVNGENKIEIRLFDENGKLVAHETSSIVVNRKARGPVFLEKPKAGSTVNDYVNIKLGLQQNLRNVYVSFFVDDKFKALTNVPPFTYLWDTSVIPNGWHEVQAWVVDSSNRTFKTEKMRLYVDNRAGRTERKDPITIDKTDTTTELVIDPPAVEAVISENQKAVTVSDPVGTKSPDISKGAMTGQRSLLPTGTRVALEASVATGSTETITPNEPAKLELKEITLGTRLAGVDEFSISLEGRFVKFDVMPRVTNGVPLTPFRHLFEHAGGEIKWTHETKTVNALGLGTEVSFSIGDEYGLMNGTQFLFEVAPFIDSGRTVVPLSFISSTLKMDVQYDPNTGHVLITSTKSK